MYMYIYIYIYVCVCVCARARCYRECFLFDDSYSSELNYSYTLIGRLAFTRCCFTSRLYCTIIFFANTPFIVQYIAQYYQLLYPPPNFDVFLRCL